MNKKTVFVISIIVNIILAVVFATVAVGAAAELEFTYVEDDTVIPDLIRSNLERENYGCAAHLSHPIRGGAEIADEYMDDYMLGEYADLLFLNKIIDCGARLEEIRDKMPDYGDILDKMDWSAENAIRK